MIQLNSNNKKNITNNIIAVSVFAFSTLIIMLVSAPKAFAYEQSLDAVCDGPVKVTKTGVNNATVKCDGSSKTMYVIREGAPAGATATHQITWVCKEDALDHSVATDLQLLCSIPPTGNVIMSVNVTDYATKAVQPYDMSPNNNNPTAGPTGTAPGLKSPPTQGTTPNSATPTCGELSVTAEDKANNPVDYCIEDQDDSSLAGTCSGDYGSDTTTGCGIVKRYISPVINFLAIGFGVLVAIMIAIGGLQYSSSGGDPQKVAAAKQRIFNAVLALIAFGILYGFLNFIVPGGI